MKTADNLRKDVMHIEMSISEKKKQLEKLVHEMKEVNLQSLTVSTDDQPIEGKFLFVAI
jgi:Ras association domain-containing protein 7/8